MKLVIVIGAIFMIAGMAGTMVLFVFRAIIIKALKSENSRLYDEMLRPNPYTISDFFPVRIYMQRRRIERYRRLVTVNLWIYVVTIVSIIASGVIALFYL
jgi:hypothetical protein